MRRPLSQQTVVAIAYVLGMFMSIMDSTIVNTALPAIAHQFHTTPERADWVVIGYLLSLAVFIPASGWLGDRVGTKRTFLTALVLFTLSSAMAGLAPSLPALVIFRIIQGIGGGMLAPVGQAMLWRAFPPAERARASAVLMLGTVTAPAVGPVLGGWLVTALSWRFVFYINLPIGIAALIFSLIRLQEHREHGAGRFDVPGFALTGLGLALLLYALSEGPLLGWLAPTVLGGGVLALITLGMLVAVEVRREQPMLKLSLFGDRLFRATNVVSFLGTAGFLGILYVMPQFLQEARHATAFSSGLSTFPEALGVLVASRFAVRIYPKVGPRRMMVAGLAFMTAVLMLFTRLELTTSVWVIRALMFACGIGWSHVILPMQAASFAGISHADTGRASSLYNTQRQTAGAVGVAVLSTVLASMLPAHGTIELRAYHVAFLAAAVFAALGALEALSVRDRDAANTMAVTRKMA
ncbi:MAG: MDR family MFS transporter [Clostridia bacterium]